MTDTKAIEPIVGKPLASVVMDALGFGPLLSDAKRMHEESIREMKKMNRNLERIIELLEVRK